VADARVSVTFATRGARAFRVGFADETKRGHQCCRQTDPEPPYRLSARNRLGQVPGQFIEFVVHIFLFFLVCFVEFFGEGLKFSGLLRGRRA
jgi:hypothetical protein